METIRCVDKTLHLISKGSFERKRVRGAFKGQRKIYTACCHSYVGKTGLMEGWSKRSAFCNNLKLRAQINEAKESVKEMTERAEIVSHDIHVRYKTMSWQNLQHVLSHIRYKYPRDQLKAVSLPSTSLPFFTLIKLFCAEAHLLLTDKISQLSETLWSVFV